MDRLIDDNARRRTRWIAAFKLLAILLAFLLAFFALRAAIEPGLSRDSIRTTFVERGDLQATIDLSGTIVPRDEVVLAAPFAAEVRERSVLAGARVKAGDPLLRLETRPLLAEIETLGERIALQGNARSTRALELERARTENKGRRELLLIDLESRQARFERLKQLAEIGAISKGDLLEAELDVRRTRVELDQLDRTTANLEATHEAALEGIDLEVSILRKQLAERQRLADLGTVTAPRAGVVTWILSDPGASVSLGQQLARIADDTAFRVEATASDFYAPRLAEGMPVHIRVGPMNKTGTLASLAPSGTEGVLQLYIDLDQPADPALRPQLRAEVEMITSSAVGALIARRGPGLQGTGLLDAWRVENGRAIRTEIELGMSNRRQIEILSGASAGDELIISDTREIDHLTAVKIN